MWELVVLRAHLPIDGRLAARVPTVKGGLQGYGKALGVDLPLRVAWCLVTPGVLGNSSFFIFLKKKFTLV